MWHGFFLKKFSFLYFKKKRKSKNYNLKTLNIRTKYFYCKLSKFSYMFFLPYLWEVNIVKNIINSSLSLFF
jgi:hypothetical protein